MVTVKNRLLASEICSASQPFTYDTVGSGLSSRRQRVNHGGNIEAWRVLMYSCGEYPIPGRDVSMVAVPLSWWGQSKGMVDAVCIKTTSALGESMLFIKRPTTSSPPTMERHPPLPLLTRLFHFPYTLPVPRRSTAESDFHQTLHQSLSTYAI